MATYAPGSARVAAMLAIVVVAGSLLPTNALLCSGADGIGRTYNPLIHVCCGGKVMLPNGPPRDFSCCERDAYMGTLYKIGKQTCCDGLVSNMTGLKCCNGRTLFDPSSQLCCVTADGSGSQRYDIVSGYEDCCGAGIYSTLSQMCCESPDGWKTNIYTKSSHSKCCGTSLYDERDAQSTCYEDVLVTRGSAVCIRSGVVTVYNTDTSICCAGIVYPKNSWTCCGGRPRPVSSHGLCCGGTYIVNSFPIECCDEPSVQTSSSGCCGGRVYNKALQRCHAGSSILQNPYGINGAICSLSSGGVMMYNLSTHICCNGDILSSSSYLCCDSKPMPRSRFETECCNGLPYDPSRSECMGDNSLRDTYGDTTTCGGRLYNAQITICCNRKMRAKSRGDRCCGSRNYFDLTHICCNDRHLHLVGTSSCNSIQKK